MSLKRKSFCVLLALVLAFAVLPMSVSANAPANMIIGIMPAWANINRISPELTISNGTASCSATVIGQPGTTSIRGTFQLQRRNTNGTWTVVRTWNSSANSSFLTWSGTNAVTAGNTYRLRCEVTVVRNGVSETAVVFSAERKA